MCCSQLSSSAPTPFVIVIEKIIKIIQIKRVKQVWDKSESVEPPNNDKYGWMINIVKVKVLSNSITINKARLSTFGHQVLG